MAVVSVGGIDVTETTSRARAQRTVAPASVPAGPAQQAQPAAALQPASASSVRRAPAALRAAARHGGRGYDPHGGRGYDQERYFITTTSPAIALLQSTSAWRATSGSRSSGSSGQACFG